MSKDGKVVIDVMSPADPNTDMSSNTVTKFMSGKFKIQFRWQPTTFDAGPAKEKRQIALASRDYPDLFFLIPWVDGFTQAGGAEARHRRHRRTAGGPDQAARAEHPEGAGQPTRH